MSTRCQVIVTDGYDELWFYRHSDGYPEGVKESLGLFLQWVKEGKIRDNVEQASGWLILIGQTEYGTPSTPNPKDGYSGWKCGAYEPSVPEQHGDIDFLYTVDLKNKTVVVQEVGYNTLGEKQLFLE